MASQTLGESTESLALSLRQPEVARLIIIDIYNINRLEDWSLSMWSRGEMLSGVAGEWVSMM